MAADITGRADFNVAEVAQLARLSLTDEEKTLFQKQLGDVLQYINKLKEVDTSGVELTRGTHGLSNVDREDNPRDWFSAEQALANAPRSANSLFIVPRVIE